MSEINKDKLIASLKWSNTVYSLARFVETFDLPQIVRIEEGYYGERISLERDQILMLHVLRTKQKFVSKDPTGRPMSISLDCPLKVQVYPLPMDCRYEKVLTEQLTFVYPKIKYLRVSEEEYMDKRECQEGPVHVGTVLEIKNISSKKRLVKCKDVATKKEVSFPFGCTTLFEPLLDCKEYTLKEAKRKFGLPIQFRFLGKVSKAREAGESVESVKLASSLGKVTLFDCSITDTAVISTTVDGKVRSKTCLQLPKELNLRVTTAEGCICGEEPYANIIEKLNQGFSASCQADFDNPDVYPYLNAASKDMNTIDGSLDERLESFKEMKEEIPELPQRHRSVDTAPSLPPKLSQWSSNKENISSRVPFDEIWKPVPFMQPSHQGSSGRGSRAVPTASRQETQLDKYEYVVPLETPKVHEYVYIDMKDIADNLEDKFETVHNLNHNKPKKCQAKGVHERIWKPTQPAAPSPRVPVSRRADHLMSEMKETHASTSRLPKDLSDLSVEGVSRLLKDLNMNCYVSTFKKELVDGKMLMSLDRECLEYLNVNTFHIVKLTKVIEGWRPNVQ